MNKKINQRDKYYVVDKAGIVVAKFRLKATALQFTFSNKTKFGGLTIIDTTEELDN